MARSKKLISLAVVLTMLVTMFASMVVINAAAKEVYTTVTEEGSDVTLTIGYRGFDADTMVGNTQVKVKLPEGFTATSEDVALTETFAKATKGVADGVIGIVHATETDYALGAEGVIATVKLTKAEGTTAGTFEITNFAIMLPDFSEVTLANGVTAVAGEYTSNEVVVDPEPTGMHVYVYGGAVVDGKVTLTIGYKNFAADTMVGNTQIKVKLPEGVTATSEDIALTETFAKATKGVADGVVGIVHATETDYALGAEGVIATVVATVDETKIPASGVKAEITNFAIMLPDFSEVTLGNGIEAYVTPITTGTTPTPTPTTTPDTTPAPTEEPKKPAVKTDVETTTKEIGGGKVKVFTASVAPAVEMTTEEIDALVVDSKYQVIFDGKTEDGYAAGWAVATVSAEKLKAALASTDGASIIDAEIAIGGADEVTVSILDSEGNTLVLDK